ncbi:MAG: hypothetical protein WBB28_15260 [Crinalium sp.]
MISHNLHSLIAAIDHILPKVSTSVSQLTPNDLLEQSLVLEQVRSYLVALDSQNSSAKIGTFGQQSVTRQVVDAVGQKIASLGSNLIKPLQAEVEIRQQQKADLTSEVGEIEELRQKYYFVEQQLARLQQTISEFLLILSDVYDGKSLRTQESLTSEVAQNLTNLDNQFLGFKSSVSEKYSTPKTTNLEKVRQLQLQSDQLLITLYSTFKFVFESLQHNFKSYQESLTKSGGNLYHQRPKSEVMFKALLNQITQQVRDLTNLHISEFGANTDTASNQTILEANQQISNTPPITNLLPNLASSFRVIQPHRVKQAPKSGKLPYSSASFISKPSKKTLGLGLINPKLDLKNQQATSSIQFQQTEIESSQLEYTPEIEEIDLDLADLGVQPIDVSDLDSFLHDEIAALTSSTLAEDALGNETQDVDETTKNIQPVVDIATITQLTDLLPADASSITVKPDSNSVVILAQLLTVDPDAAVVEDNYLLASSKEDLIPTNKPSIQSDIKHFLPQDTLRQLTEDLSMFEWCKPQTFSEQTPMPIVDLIAKAPTEVTILKYQPQVLQSDENVELDLFSSESQHLEEDLPLNEETLINNPFTLDFPEDFNDSDYPRKNKL